MTSRGVVALALFVGAALGGYLASGWAAAAAAVFGVLAAVVIYSAGYAHGYEEGQIVMSEELGDAERRRWNAETLLAEQQRKEAAPWN